MEELLASIRKAIHDDIGEVPASMSAQASGRLQRGATRELHVRAEDTAAAASEIQYLRDKINRTRGLEPALAARPQSLSEALQAEPVRRSTWRDAEPPPRLRPTTAEADTPILRAETIVEPPRYAEPRPEPRPQWREETAALPPPIPPRDSFRAKPAVDPMLSGDSAQAVQSAFSRLADTVLARATGERSLEEMTRDMLRVMLKQWLDDHLPSLVERLVREEIERVARSGR